MRVAYIGWRGMVGSVLTRRMLEEGDFSGNEWIFCSTSQAGQKAPDLGFDLPPLANAFDEDLLRDVDVVLTCQGGDYTSKIYPKLRKSGWRGYWIDAASTLRMEDDALIILDPVNRTVIDQGLDNGIRTFVGGNCTVSLMLMALSGLFNEGYIEWLTSMTYQAASGAGARNMRELVAQMGCIGDSCATLLNDPSTAIFDIDRQVTSTLGSSSFPTDNFGAPLAASLIPWIDCAVDAGQTREEWKGFVETNKILGSNSPIPIDGICVRIGAMRSHCQAFTIKMNKDIPVADIEALIGAANDWVRVIPNEPAATKEHLTPAAVSGTLDIPVGRIRKMNLGPKYLSAFSAGDQLLWGAAEPLRRMLKIIQER